MNGFNTVHNNIEALCKEKKKMIAQIHLQIEKSGKRVMGLPVSKITDQIEDQDKWILPHGLELFVASVTYNHKHIDPITNETLRCTVRTLDCNKMTIK